LAPRQSAGDLDCVDRVSWERLRTLVERAADLFDEDWRDALQLRRDLGLGKLGKSKGQRHGTQGPYEPARSLTMCEKHVSGSWLQDEAAWKSNSFSAAERYRSADSIEVRRLKRQTRTSAETRQRGTLVAPGTDEACAALQTESQRPSACLPAGSRAAVWIRDVRRMVR
jgi:hypothetical protein